MDKISLLSQTTLNEQPDNFENQLEGFFGHRHIQKVFSDCEEVYLDFEDKVKSVRLPSSIHKEFLVDFISLMELSESKADFESFIEFVSLLLRKRFAIQDMQSIYKNIDLSLSALPIEKGYEEQYQKGKALKEETLDSITTLTGEMNHMINSFMSTPLTKECDSLCQVVNDIIDKRVLTLKTGKKFQKKNLEKRLNHKKIHLE